MATPARMTKQTSKKRREDQEGARARPSGATGVCNSNRSGDENGEAPGGDSEQSGEAASAMLLTSPSSMTKILHDEHDKTHYRELPRNDTTASVLSLLHARRRQIQWRFWAEKVVVICDAMQIYALVWQLSQPWPWPARWLRATRWVNAFNLDFFSFQATGAAMGATSQPFSLWGEMRHYWVYALLWALLPTCGWIGVRVLITHWRRSGRSDYFVLKMQLENAMLQIYQVLYLPIGLAALRLVNCDGQGIVSVDPFSVGACWSARHAAVVVVITICLGGSFLVGFPWFLNKRIHKYLTQLSVAKHERFVQSKELEFVLGTSETFLDLHMPLYASFQRHSVRVPVEMCCLKLVLLVIFSLLRSPFPSKANQGPQGTLFVVAISCFAIKRTMRPQFRVVSSSHLAQVVDWALVANGLFVLLCANGVRSAFTVSTTMTSCLSFINICSIVVIGFALLQSCRQWMMKRIDYQKSSSDSSIWPTRESDESTVLHGTSLLEWVDNIKQAKAVLLKALLMTPSMRSVEELSATFQRLQTSREEALQSDHLLADQLSELLLYVHEIYVEALACNPYHRMRFPESELIQLTHALQRRDHRQVLLSSRSRRVLSKVKASSTWKSSVKPMIETPFEGNNTAVPGNAVRSFFENESARYGSEAALVGDWEVVNSLFAIRDTQMPTYVPSPDLLRVLRWSRTTNLVQVQLEPFEKSGDYAFAMTNNIQHRGFKLELVECGEIQATENVLVGLQGGEVGSVQSSEANASSSNRNKGDKNREFEELMVSTEAVKEQRQASPRAV